MDADFKDEAGALERGEALDEFGLAGADLALVGDITVGSDEAEGAEAVANIKAKGRGSGVGRSRVFHAGHILSALQGAIQAAR
jgi:hypothetical protein